MRTTVQKRLRNTDAKRPYHVNNKSTDLSQFCWHQIQLKTDWKALHTNRSFWCRGSFANNFIFLWRNPACENMFPNKQTPTKSFSSSSIELSWSRDSLTGACESLAALLAMNIPNHNETITFHIFAIHLPAFDAVFSAATNLLEIRLRLSSRFDWLKTISNFASKHRSA